jgi:glucosylceramidase
LEKQNPIYFENKQNKKKNFTITINDKIQYQTMEGFGASLTDASSWLLHYQLDEKIRNEIMNDLFSENGIHISFM